MLKTCPNSPYQFYRGSFLQSISDQAVEYLEDGIAVVSNRAADSGRILFMGPAMTVGEMYKIDLGELPKAVGLFLPAFYDLHFHWVQDDVREMPKASLLDWLELYTFPAEAKYADEYYALEKAAYFWKRIVSLGTIGGLCYSSIHEIALKAAMEVAPENFRLGNVLMTMNCPDSVRQTEKEAIASVRSCAAAYGDRYVSSPRFAPTTPPTVMKAAAEAAKAHGCFQQTHLAENLAEIDWVLSMYRNLPEFADVASYTDIYNRVGMLGPKTVFGHCIHLSDADWRMLADSGSIIASCPSSNAPIEQLGLGSGLFDFRKADAFGVRWALCSDIGGGPYLSMFDVMDSFVSQNRKAGNERAGYVQALYRSTTVGAELLGWGETKGRLQVGYDFDCIRVPLETTVAKTGDAEKILESVVRSVCSREAFDDLVEATIIKGRICFEKGSAV